MANLPRLRSRWRTIFSNPVPEGTLVEFRTELGHVDKTCATVLETGICTVVYSSADPRIPIDTEVSFRNLVDDNCPSRLIIDERTTIAGSTALTDYRVSSVKRVADTSGTVFAANTYTAVANGIECVSTPCSNGTAIDITYDRLWLDEVDDASSDHFISNPGGATEPFLDTTGTPCLAGVRDELEVITGSINPSGTAAVTGVGTAFKLELVIGDRLKVRNEVRTIIAIGSNTSLIVDTAFSDGDNDVSPKRVATPGYLGGMGQPYGARSTILAFALGEESFVDVNGNKEYDFGETFFDLPEVFMDKNTDGVLGDVDGESASVTNEGPYTDSGSGGDPVGGKRDKSSPFCYGPKTIVGLPSGAGSSTELETYCYQDGGEEEFFIDANGNDVMDLGNGIYNGSRCLRPLQDSDGDFDEDDIVCTTELVNISQQVEILLAGSGAFIQFRTNATGGANGGGEIIKEVELASGGVISNTAPPPVDWEDVLVTAVTEVSVQKGAVVDTDTNLAGGERRVELFTLPDVFTKSGVDWVVTFTVERTDAIVASPSGIEIFANGVAIPFDAGNVFCGDVISDTCTATISSTLGIGTGDLIVATNNDGTDGTSIFAEINGFSITGTIAGLTEDYGVRFGGTVEANDNTTIVTEFNVGDTSTGASAATTVFAGVSERLYNGSIPSLSTSITSLLLYFTDKYNGQLPDGTTIEVESDNSAGCTIASVGGVAVNSNDPGPTSGGLHSGTVTVGTDTSMVTSVNLSTGTGSGSVSVFVRTPNTGETIHTITCDL